MKNLRKELVIFTTVPFLFFGVNDAVERNYKREIPIESKVYAAEFFYDLHRDKDLESRLRYAQDLATQSIRVVENAKDPQTQLLRKFLDTSYIERVSKDNKIPFSVNMEGFHVSIGFYNGYIGLTDEINYEQLKNKLPVGAVYKITVVRDITQRRYYDLLARLVEDNKSKPWGWPFEGYDIRVVSLKPYDYLRYFAAMSNNVKFYFHVREYLTEDQRKKFEDNVFKTAGFHGLSSALIRSYVLVEGVYNIEMIHWLNRANYLDIYSFMHSNSLDNVVAKIQEARKFHQFPDDIITPVEFANNAHNLLFIVEQFYQLLNKEYLEEIMRRTRGEFIDKDSLNRLKQILGYDNQRIDEYYRRLSDQARGDLESYVRRFDRYGKANEVREMIILLNLEMDRLMTGSLLMLGNLNLGFYNVLTPAERKEYVRQGVSTINDIFNVSGFADFNRQGLWYNAQTYIVRHMNNVRNYHQSRFFELEKEFYFGCEHLGNWKRRYIDIVYPVIMDKDAYGVIEYVK